ncbi:MAG TPA: type II toxin-antitoxin system RelE/ParE family toxin [Bradyrhizobium sp.]
MKLVFDDQALADLERIFSWIAQDSPSNAKAVIDRLFSSAELLISFPLIGHVGRVRGTFEWVVPRLPYIVVYEVDQVEGQVVVTAVFHAAQDRKGE